MEDLTTSPKLVETKIDKLDENQREATELQFPTIRLEASLESLMSCSQPSSSTATIMPERQSSAPDLDESWTAIDSTDCSPDDDGASENTDVASTLDMNSIGDSESIIAETDEEGTTDEITRQVSNPQPNTKTPTFEDTKSDANSLNTTDAQVTVAQCRGSVQGVVGFPHLDVDGPEPRIEEVKLADTVWELVSLASFSTVGNIICALLITVLACFITDLISTYRTVARPGLPDSTLARSSSTATCEIVTAATPSVIVNQKEVSTVTPIRFRISKTHESGRQNVAMQIDEDTKGDSDEMTVFSERALQPEEAIWRSSERLHSSEAPEATGIDTAVSTPDKADASVKSGLRFAPQLVDGVQQFEGTDTYRPLRTTKVLEMWVVETFCTIVSKSPLNATVICEMLQDGHRWADTRFWGKQASLEEVDLRLQDERPGSFTIQQIQTRAQALAQNMQHYTKAIVDEAAQTAKAVETSGREYQQTVQEKLRALRKSSMELGNSLLLRAEDIKHSCRGVLRRAQHQARDIVAG